MNKIALVTGANKGIGFEIARQLGKAGFTVFVGARNAALGEEAAANLLAEKLESRSIELDLGRQETITSAASAIKSFAGHLDVLVNNAAIADPADGPPSTVDITTVERIMQTNFFGTLRVTQAMLPLLREAPAGRVVNLSSGLGSLTLNGDPKWDFAGFKLLGYNTSKAALNMLTIQLAYELRDTPIKVNAAHPGSVVTDMNANGEIPVEEGAKTSVSLATLPNDGYTGKFIYLGNELPW